MKYLIYILLFCHIAQLGFTQPKFQLAPPIFNFKSVFYKDSMQLQMVFAQSETIIRYTTNGLEPNEQSAIYKFPITIKDKLTTVKAKVFSNNFLPSQTVESTFIPDGLKLQSVSFPSPNLKYIGEGSNTLMDNRGGRSSFESTTWLGFQQDTVTITILLASKQKVQTVLFNLLQDQDSWIFFPEKVEIFVAKRKAKGLRKVGEMQLVPKQNMDQQLCKPFSFSFAKGRLLEQINLKFYVLKSIPNWHVGSGNSSWIFMDEVKVY